ncbi:MAG: DUF480 domain-containing protein [Acidobacteriia bacterium]|nr:DUF480 domain-containing protein [Terriglobia bacterium]
MNIILNPAEARVLGALVEKDITTPDYYLLSCDVEAWEPPAETASFSGSSAEAERIAQLSRL